MTDGGTLTDLAHLFEVTVWHILDDAMHFLHQLPTGLSAHIDSVKFASSITRAAEPIESNTECPSGDVQRVPATPWATAHIGYTCHSGTPEDEPPQTEDDKKYMEAHHVAQQCWADWQSQNARLIPYTACKQTISVIKTAKVAFRRGTPLGEYIPYNPG